MKELCRSLRWKGRQGEQRTAGALRFAIELNNVPWTCIKTCQPWGPDDAPVEPGRCQGDRACFAADRNFDPTGGFDPTC